LANTLKANNPLSCECLQLPPAGSILGLCILAFSWVWSGISLQVGAAVAIALPVRTQLQQQQQQQVADGFL
jgi:hypothetical protein